MPTADRTPQAWWSLDAAALAAELGSSSAGLSVAEAQARLARCGPNRVAARDERGAISLLLRQLRSPLVLILVAGALLSLLLRDWTDAVTILVILAGSALLGFTQELRASQAVARLRDRLALSVRVRRDGRLQDMPAEALVPGDVIELAAGRLVPADGLLLESRGLLVGEASLTGESLPVEKRPGAVTAASALAQRSNCVYLGSSVRSGWAAVLVVCTGRGTVLADLASRLGRADEETSFERGVRHFGDLLLRVMFAVVLAVLAANWLLGRPAVDSLLFAAALAVGLSPELLPAIVSVSLARGARALAGRGVLVRRLDAIEDLGEMDVLATDKTGTLTVGTLALVAAVDAQGAPSSEVLRLAHLNAAFEAGITNPIDQALVQAGHAAGLATEGWAKFDEIPYDFERRRLTVVVRSLAPNPPHVPVAGEDLLVTKGAVDNVLAVCALEAAERERLAAQARAKGERGLRVLAVATRQIAYAGQEPVARDAPGAPRYDVSDEQGLAFAGFLHFADPPKADARQAVLALRRRGVRVKMITGDNRHVAAHVAGEVGVARATRAGASVAAATAAGAPAAVVPRLLTGEQVAAMSDEALAHQVVRTDVFAEVEPAQKERIVRALKRAGHTVGFLGDGINDAPALHAADVGISVDQAADVARESADIVLLRPDLAVLERGIAEGRRTFANTLKYIQITTSANFGNMVSMAVATPLLPFLPLTATQILANNFLSDFPSLAIAGDRVDAAPLRRARRWDLAEVRRFMIVFGLVSSAFDLMMFALLRRVFEADAPLFHSAWFVFSLLTELAVVLVLRTRGAMWASRASPLLLALTAVVAAVAFALPCFGPLAHALGLVPLPATLAIALVAMLLGYVTATEAAKRWFFRPRAVWPRLTPAARARARHRARWRSGRR
jgi:Mg2+-importing ATPase